MFYLTTKIKGLLPRCGFLGRDDGETWIYYADTQGIVYRHRPSFFSEYGGNIAGIIRDEYAYSIWRDRIPKPDNIRNLVLTEVYKYNLETYISHLKKYGKSALSVLFATKQLENVKTRYGVIVPLSSYDVMPEHPFIKYDKPVTYEELKCPWPEHRKIMLVPEELKAAVEIIDLEEKVKKFESKEALRRFRRKIKKS